MFVPFIPYLKEWAFWHVVVKVKSMDSGERHFILSNESPMITSLIFTSLHVILQKDSSCPFSMHDATDPIFIAIDPP